MEDVAVIHRPEAAQALLDPIRARLLVAFGDEDSATTLAGRLGVPRQKVNYHLRELERHGLVELAGERRRGNMTERMLRRTARSYVVSPAVVPALAPDPADTPDRLSAAWLVALGARLVAEVGELSRRARRAGQPLATFGLDAEITFPTPAARASFVTDLTSAVEELAAAHGGAASGGRRHRLVVALHPLITKTEEEDHRRVP